jgi:hypothetical protein
MSGIKLRVEKYFEGDLQHGEVLANVYPLAGTPRSAGKRNVVVPVTGEDFYQEIDLHPGSYMVEAELPSGDLISKQVDVADVPAKAEVSLETDQTPHEWLGWQQVVGNFEEPLTHPTRQAPTSRIVLSPYRPRPKEALLGDPSAAAPPEFEWDFVRLSRYRLTWIESLPEALKGGAPQGGEVWVPLGGARNPNDVLDVSAGSDLSPSSEDQEVALYDLKSYGRVDPNRPGEYDIPEGSDFPRKFILVENPVLSELVSLPVPWPVTDYGLSVSGEHLCQLAVGALRDASGRAAVTIQDPRMGALMAYMRQGQLPKASALLTDRARDMLFAKMSNPLAATAGAYVLLATEGTPEEKSWHQWIRNLRNWHKWLPDGAILHAWLLLKHQSSDEDVDEALKALLEGFDRGLPFFTNGVRVLLDGLTMFSKTNGETDQEVTKREAAVRRVARRLNHRQPFTSVLLRARGL